MPIKITFDITEEQIRIEAPQVQFMQEIPNVMAINQDQKIVAIGETPDQIKTKYHDLWDQFQAQHYFVNPFDLRTNGVGYAIALMWYYATLVKQKRFLGAYRRYSPVDCELRIKNYDDLALELRQEFEYALKRHKLLNLHQLTINGFAAASVTSDFLRRKKQVRWQYNLASWSLRVCILLWLMICFVPIWLILKTGGGFYTQSLLIGILGLLCVLFVVYLIISACTLLGATTWLLLMRKYIPVEILQELLPTSGTPKWANRWLKEKLLDEFI